MPNAHVAREFLKEAARLRTTVSYKALYDYAQVYNDASTILLEVAKADLALRTPPLVSLVTDAPEDFCINFIKAHCILPSALNPYASPDNMDHRLLKHYQSLCYEYYYGKLEHYLLKVYKGA